MSQNDLAHETSPYLLQHKDNPVRWRAWGPTALAEAKAANKPILLSVGYAACHWCHVMAHESFEDPAVADVMNALYVPIKVDREERPDIDAIYQQALAALGEQGGWPLTMFLTPAGEPFWGGTYFPPTARWGRPSFVAALQGVAEVYRNDDAKVMQNVAALREALGRLSAPQSGGAVAPALLDQIAERLNGQIDPIHGGIGGAPKFPNPTMLDLLWRGWKRGGQNAARDSVLLTLDRMSQGGIYDHLGGGYARYSTDERWLAPHFEKMLYDNAQLVDLLTHAWQDTGRPLYAERVTETIAWIHREMTLPGGGFAGTLDADSEGVEGKFTVWAEAEIDRVLSEAGLGDHTALFKRHYDVSAEGNWESHTILNRSATPELGDPATEAILAECRAALLVSRETRVRPGLDDKVLADWNGLMIAALAHAGFAFDRPDWIDLGVAAFDFITATLMDRRGRLAHSWRAGKSHPGTLDDYADMSRAALTLHEVTGGERYLTQAIAWVAVLDRHFADPTAGGYFFTADDTEALITRTKSIGDAAVPSGNGVMVGVLARLHLLTGDVPYRAKAEALVAAFSGELARNFFPLSSFLNGIDFLNRPLQVAIIGSPGAPDTRALLAVLRRLSLPNLVLTVLPPGGTLPPGHPAAGKTPRAGAATAYVCEGPVCSLPITDPRVLEADLRGR
ncbi:MAG TPA: thioredoxin domain-containing protein [Stellaceae bacterium]|nr:thioredoxin domain-containing protein [Stellaceae bacterium]